MSSVQEAEAAPLQIVRLPEPDAYPVTLGIIGDLHGDAKRYEECVRNVDYSIQVGDFGILSSELPDDINQERHKVLRGNHEFFSNLQCSKRSLPYWGLMTLGDKWSSFFLGGALSVDRGLPGSIPWDPREETSFSNLWMAYRAYRDLTPDVLIAHEAPLIALKTNNIKGMSLNPPFQLQSITAQTLQLMFEFHKPKEFYHGHWHLTASKKKEGTYFRGLGIGEMKVLVIE